MRQFPFYGAIILILAGCSTPQPLLKPEPINIDTLFQGSSTAFSAATLTSSDVINEPAVSSSDKAALGDSDTAQHKSYPGSGEFVAKNRQKPALSGVGEITLNFEATDIREVVKIILADLLGKNYLIDPKVQGLVNFQTTTAMEKSELIPLLETLLRMNGAALVERQGRSEIVPVSAVLTSGLVPQLGDSSQPLPQGYSVRVVQLRYVSATEMVSILKPIASQESVIRVDSVRNLLILAGTGPEMNNLIETVKLFDVDWMKGLSVGLYALQYSPLTDVMEGLQRIVGEGGDSPLAGLLRIVAIEKSNSILVVTPQAHYLKRIEEWIARLDQAGEESGGGGERIYVYRIQNVKAADLATLLNQIYGDVDANGAVTGSTGSAARVAPREQAVTLKSGGLGASLGSSTSSFGSSTSGLSSSASSTTPAASGVNSQSSANNSAPVTVITPDGVRIVANEQNNSLVIVANARQFRKIEQALKQLDEVPLQVLIEARVMEISLDDELKYGLQWFFESIKGDKTRQLSWDNSLDNSSTSGLGTLFPGVNFSMVSSSGDIHAIFGALAKKSLLKILSAPSVMVLDNQAARIQVGDQIPIATLQQSGTSADSIISTSIQYRDTGIVLDVKPRVNPGGLVVMDIVQEVSDVAITNSSSLDSPSFQTRKISSSIAVQSGQSIILGGLMRSRNDNARGGVPGLLDLPLFSWLFGQESTANSQTELVVVITPRVVGSSTQITAVNEEYRNKLHRLQLPF
ncbi:MAG: type II secretion system secretin GspD [Gammaproteobacteria bacterium]|nr:type II secretion system secretin GspD [Gammaproteobacteria bacterium]